MRFARHSASAQGVGNVVLALGAEERTIGGGEGHRLLFRGSCALFRLSRQHTSRQHRNPAENGKPPRQKHFGTSAACQTTLFPASLNRIPANSSIKVL